MYSIHYLGKYNADANYAKEVKTVRTTGIVVIPSEYNYIDKNVRF